MGQVYGRTLTALVIDGRSLDTPPRKRLHGRDVQAVFEGASGGNDEGTREDGNMLEDNEGGRDGSQGTKKVSRPKWVHFGEHGSAQVVDVACRIPKS